MARPKKDSVGDRRADLLEAATALFLEKGFAGASMAALAANTGIQKPSLYHYFENKEALFVACVTEGFDVAIQKLTAIKNDQSLFHEDRLDLAVDELYHITVQSEVGQMSPIIAEVSTRIPGIGEQFYRGFIERQFVVIDEIIEAGIAGGAFRNELRLGLRHVIFGPIVTLSLCRQMLAGVPGRETLLPMNTMKDEHKTLIKKLLLD